ncbi:hypothetical protein D9758_006785 [Tetrapyrgos nigripes]|uniref:Uncharacterized protein n=1 Tax=Tetrapyrgos nigripes TaxID=182062 RepID=A0A8H5FTP0_9AGAR|nr:hypothetical protein D9758_006785 [Tetrapyrgos nigripes]
MSKADEETIPLSYKYHWSQDSEMPLKDFLAKYRPSMVQNDGTKPWIWVSPPNKDDEHRSSRGEDQAIEEGCKLLEEVTARVEEIKNDSSIPARSSKKTGAKGKKEIREQVQAEATEKLKEIALEHDYVVGKWLLFAPQAKVDAIWSDLATSLVEGPLAKTKAFRAKVATSPPSETPNYQHVMCLYIPNVYDKDTVTSIMKILLRNHGFNLSGVKSDLYTLIGLDSKHPSGIQSTELKEQYFAELMSNKSSAETSETTGDVSEKSNEPSAAKAKSKPKPKKKNDPFESDDDDKDDGAKKRAKDSDDEEEQPKKKQK